jgi:methyltransferase (TIGR00027 family)
MFGGNLAETARITAYARALESERPDALFEDPNSRRLAGSEVEILVREAGLTAAVFGAIASRTAVFDELVMRKVRQEGADLVINLAAGFDTRPWRLNLPPRLRWIDVDLPEVLAHKVEVMRAQTARCAYIAAAADITHPDALADLLSDLGGAKRVLAVTEGLLVYLRPEQVSDLARRLHDRKSIAWWITDLATRTALVMMERMLGKALRGVRLQFAPADPAEFFARCGWVEAEFRSSQEEARRLGRAPRLPLLARIAQGLASARVREEIRRLSGCVVLARAEESGGAPRSLAAKG